MGGNVLVHVQRQRSWRFERLSRFIRLFIYQSNKNSYISSFSCAALNRKACPLNLVALNMKKPLQRSKQCSVPHRGGSWQLLLWAVSQVAWGCKSYLHMGANWIWFVILIYCNLTENALWISMAKASNPVKCIRSCDRYKSKNMHLILLEFQLLMTTFPYLFSRLGGGTLKQ